MLSSRSNSMALTSLKCREKLMKVCLFLQRPFTFLQAYFRFRQFHTNMRGKNLAIGIASVWACKGRTSGKEYCC